MVEFYVLCLIIFIIFFFHIKTIVELWNALEFEYGTENEKKKRIEKALY